MSSDHRKLKVFTMGHELVLDVYRLTKQMPPDERFGLTSQIRRAAVSVPNNLVEGCSRSTRKDFVRFVITSLGSASEVRYLFQIAREIDALPAEKCFAIERRYDDLIRALQSLATSMQSSD